MAAGRGGAALVRCCTALPRPRPGPAPTGRLSSVPAHRAGPSACPPPQVVLVELINPLMTQSAWLRSRRWWVQALSFASFYAGVTVMAVIGKYA